MLGDAEAAEVVALPGVFPVAAVRGEVEPAEEQGAFGEFTHVLGAAAEPVAEDFGVGTGGGDVLAGDHVLVGAFDHGGEGGAARVVVGAFAGEGVVEGGVG
ncbi:hypothetical protein SAVCW2_39970 [Streptomyces avermitilis]|nr:hypothetical protein SAVCW2_39970 [Streptomyces avermitilis]